MTHQDIKLFASELLGTAIMMVAGVGAIYINFGEGSAIPTFIPSMQLRLALTGGCFGIGIIGVIHSPPGKRSGAHLNPAISIAFWMQKKLATWHLLLYMAAQCIGAFVGALIISRLLPELATSVRYGATSVSPQISSLAGFFLEFLLTAILVTMIFWMTSCPIRSKYTGLSVLVYLVVFVTIAGPLTGVGVNPARSIGPAILSGYCENLAVYIMGPILGAVAGTLFSRRFLDHQPLCHRICRAQDDQPRQTY